MFWTRIWIFNKSNLNYRNVRCFKKECRKCLILQVIMLNNWRQFLMCSLLLDRQTSKAIKMHHFMRECMNEYTLQFLACERLIIWAVNVYPNYLQTDPGSSMPHSLDVLTRSRMSSLLKPSIVNPSGISNLMSHEGCRRSQRDGKLII